MHVHSHFKSREAAVCSRKFLSRVFLNALGKLGKFTGTIRTVMTPTDTDGNVADMDFESLVTRYYRPLFQFALSLTHAEADACDLTQQTFFLWASKGHQLRDKSKVKTWLFTTLHREFLETQRRRTRFSHLSLEETDYDLPSILPEAMSRLDGKEVLATLGKVGEPYQAALALFYLEDCSYKEIAEILDVPLGTVQSRIARGLAQLHRLLNETFWPMKGGKRE